MSKTANVAYTSNQAVIFARVSTARQEKEGLSLDEIQLPRTRAYAKEHNLKVAKEFAVGETGGSYKERKCFNEMVEYVKAHPNIKHIIAFRIDRITRNFRDAVTADELRLQYDVTLHFVDERLALDRRSKGADLTSWNAKVFVGQEYVNRAKEDGLNTKEDKLSRGELPWNAPFGYEFKTISPKNKTVVFSDKAVIVRKMFDLFSTGTYSCKSMAQYVKQEYGVKLSQSRVCEILHDKFYIGYIVDRKDGDKEYRHKYEHLIDEDTFYDVEDILSGHTKKRRRFAGVPSVYRGLITCADCGCTITPDYKTKKQKNGNVHHYYYYHCSNGTNAHETVTNVSESVLDEGILSVLRKLKLTDEQLVDLKDKLRQSHKASVNFNETRRKSLATERQKLEERQQKSYDLLMDGSITPEEYNKNKDRYAAEIERIRYEENGLNDDKIKFYENIGHLLKIFQYADKLYEAADINEKRLIVGLVLSNLQLSGKQLSFTLNEPFSTVLSCENGSVWLG